MRGALVFILIYGIYGQRQGFGIGAWMRASVGIFDGGAEEILVAVHQSGTPECRVFHYGLYLGAVGELAHRLDFMGQLREP